MLTVVTTREPKTTSELLLFVAEGCQPCDVMKRRVADAADGQAVEVRIVNVWDDPQQGVHHEVLTVPTLVIREDGVEVRRLEGVKSARRLSRAMPHSTTPSSPAPRPPRRGSVIVATGLAMLGGACGE